MESAKLGANTRERGLMLARIAVISVLVALTFLTLEIFLRAIGWAGIIAFVTFGLYRRLRDWTGLVHVTAGFMTFAVLLVLGVPLGVVLGVLAEQAIAILQSIQDWIAQGSSPSLALRRPFRNGSDGRHSKPPLGRI